MDIKKILKAFGYSFEIVGIILFIYFLSKGFNI